MAEEVLTVDQIKVELKRHRGIKQTAIGPLEVDVGQSVVFVNGIWAGYVPDDPAGHISLILSGLPADVLQHIKAEVERIRKTPSPAIVQAKILEESNVELTTDEEPLS